MKWIATILVLASCGYSVSKKDVPVILPGEVVSLAKHVEPAVMRPFCISCHAGFGMPLDFAAVLKNVKPGDSKGSKFFQVIDEGLMPKNQGRLSQDLVDLVARWIDEGAKP